MENLTSEKIGNVIILGLVAGLWWVNTFITLPQGKERRKGGCSGMRFQRSPLVMTVSHDNDS